MAQDVNYLISEGEKETESWLKKILTSLESSGRREYITLDIENKNDSVTKNALKYLEDILTSDNCPLTVSIKMNAACGEHLCPLFEKIFPSGQCKAKQLNLTLPFLSLERLPKMLSQKMPPTNIEFTYYNIPSDLYFYSSEDIGIMNGMKTFATFLKSKNYPDDLVLSFPRLVNETLEILIDGLISVQGGRGLKIKMPSLSINNRDEAYDKVKQLLKSPNCLMHLEIETTRDSFYRDQIEEIDRLMKKREERINSPVKEQNEDSFCCDSVLQLFVSFFPSSTPMPTPTENTALTNRPRGRGGF